MSADIPGVLAAHEVGGFCGTDTACICDRTWRRNDDYRTHVAEQITAHLRDVVLGAREDVAVALQQSDPGNCTHSDPERGGLLCATCDADAALAVVVGVLGGAE